MCTSCGTDFLHPIIYVYILKVISNTLSSMCASCGSDI